MLFILHSYENSDKKNKIFDTDNGFKSPIHSKTESFSMFYNENTIHIVFKTCRSFAIYKFEYHFKKLNVSVTHELFTFLPRQKYTSAAYVRTKNLCFKNSCTYIASTARKKKKKSG